MISLSEITEHIDAYLNLDKFADHSLNGLQVEGAKTVSKIGAAVDSGISVIEQAAAANCDLLLVHHGFFWGNPLAITGAHKEAVTKLLDSQMSLYAAHLPLDAHPELGNNYALAKLIGLSNLVPAIEYEGQQIGCVGETSNSFQELKTKLEQLPGAVANFRSLEFHEGNPKRVCVATGSAADQLYRFKEDSFDTLITGEPKQFAYHYCKDNKLNALFAGHYATETIGVCNLAKHLSKKFNLQWEFIDHPTGI